MIGAAVGAVFGGSAVELINSAISGNAAVAQPHAYALVGMAATLASVCYVPLASVLLLFELTKDYRILLPLMGAVGLAIWVPSVVNQAKEIEASDTKSPSEIRSLPSVTAFSLTSVISPAESPKSSADFGIKTMNSQLGPFSLCLSQSPAKKSGFRSANSCLDIPNSPRILTGCLSTTEMELSKDYTCAIPHRPILSLAWPPLGGHS